MILCEANCTQKLIVKFTNNYIYIYIYIYILEREREKLNVKFPVERLKLCSLVKVLYLYFC